MDNNLEHAEELLNTILSKLPLVDKNDLSFMADIMQSLDSISENTVLPPAFRSLAKRSGQLVKNIIYEETKFDSGLIKLNKSVKKMVGTFEEIKQKLSNNSPVHGDELEEDDGSTEKNCIPDDLKDLVCKFGSQQQQVLEDFEASCLDYENNVEGAVGSIKRILHTWKGEFGVLNLQKYSAFIHGIEEKIAEKTLSSESLFRLKDFLTDKFSVLAGGAIPELNEEDMDYILNQQPHTITEDSEQEKKENFDETHGEILPECGPEEEDAISSAEERDMPVSHSNQENRDVDISNNFQNDISLLSDFVSESHEHLDNVEPLVLNLEGDPDDIDPLNTIFRACHTIKGVAGFLGFDEINQLAHSLENILDRGRKGDLHITQGFIDIILQGIDSLRGLIKIVEGVISGEEYVVPEMYREIIKKLNAPEILEEQESKPPDKLGELLVKRGDTDISEVNEALEKQQRGDRRKVGEILIEDSAVSPQSVNRALERQKTGFQKKKNIEETIRVPVERLDQLIDSIGEAVIAQSMVHADPVLENIRDRSLEKKISHASLILRQIQELSMSLRMVSIKSTFQKMARLVRDLSKKSNKRVHLIMEGEDTELDKTVVENIGDPLMHMIRNSIDHGIETEEERVKLNKNKTATVCLRAFHRAGSVVIEIEDDGRGLDKNAIYKKAVERNLMLAKDNYTDQEIFQFIFLPGFSTAKVVTDVSGRGVGMDVVKRNIEALRGSTEIKSERGEGTCFSLKLPLTLAIIDGMVVKVGNETYIIPTLSIVESLKAREDQIDNVLERGESIKVRGDLHTLIRLSDVFNCSIKRDKLSNGIIMIVEDMMNKKIGLYVDDIVGQQQVVIKSIGSSIGDIQGISGGAIMSDGTVSLILDISGLVRMATS